ncbi:MAG: hypothetical protein WBM86_01330 [Waterburya sp.]
MTQRKKIKNNSCYHCEGKGYTEIRDCAGKIQRTETCSHCEGRGYTDSQREAKS